jgi:hypothetical protein
MPALEVESVLESALELELRRRSRLGRLLGRRVDFQIRWSHA